MAKGSQSHFAHLPDVQIQRSVFRRDHQHKTTFDAGFLVPVYVDEVLPGDSFKLTMSHFARLATPLRPIMDNLYLESFFFFVPNRLIWDNWQKMMGERDTPYASIDYVVPHDTSDGIDPGTLEDYFGLPTRSAGPLPISHVSLYRRAYQLIWNEHFRDQNLQDSIAIDTGDGDTDIGSGTPLLRRGKRHDYFTSALPWPQKGADSEIALVGTAPIGSYDGTGRAVVDSFFNGSTPTDLRVGTTSNVFSTVSDPNVAGDLTQSIDTNDLYADLSSAAPVTINALREAFQIQRLLERDARGGTRYIEIIRSHFGVVSPDQRLQRPEFLGGGRSTVNITSVPNTAGGDSPQGTLAAYGVSAGAKHGFTRSFVEHGVIIGLVCVRADLTYQQGLQRPFSRRTRYDYYWPALSRLGEQEVLTQEIYYTDVEPLNQSVWGFQERYAEYRYKPSIITGLMRSNHPQSLDVWHLSQDFGSPPWLGPSFIEERPPIDRVVAVPSEPHFIFDAYFRLRCARPMPTYAVPGMIDHF